MARWQDKAGAGVAVVKGCVGQASQREKVATARSGRDERRSVGVLSRVRALPDGRYRVAGERCRRPRLETRNEKMICTPMIVSVAARTARRSSPSWPLAVPIHWTKMRLPRTMPPRAVRPPEPSPCRSRARSQMNRDLAHP